MGHRSPRSTRSSVAQTAVASSANTVSRNTTTKRPQRWRVFRQFHQPEAAQVMPVAKRHTRSRKSNGGFGQSRGHYDSDVGIKKLSPRAVKLAKTLKQWTAEEINERLEVGLGYCKDCKDWQFGVKSGHCKHHRPPPARNEVECRGCHGMILFIYCDWLHKRVIAEPSSVPVEDNFFDLKRGHKFHKCPAYHKD